MSNYNSCIAIAPCYDDTPRGDVTEALTLDNIVHNQRATNECPRPLPRKAIPKKQQRSAGQIPFPKNFGPSWSQCQGDIALGYHHVQILVPNIMTFIPTMARTGLDPTLEQAILAVGGTGLAIAHRSTSAQELAHTQYGRALRLVAGALGDSKRARSDQTLVAVYLLSVFDSVEVRETWDSWANHVSGLLELLRLRREDADHSKSPVVDALLPALRVNTLLYCFLNGTPVPTYMLGDSEELRIPGCPATYTGSPLDAMMRLINDWSVLRADLKRSEKTTDPRSAKAQLESMEKRYSTWCAVTPSLHPTWSCKIIDATETKPEAWKGTHRIYLNPLFSKIWQLCFLARAFMAQGQLQCVARQPDLFPPSDQLFLSVAFLDLTDESCANFPLPLRRETAVLDQTQTSASSRISADMWTINVVATTIKDVMVMLEKSELWLAPKEERGLLSDVMKRNLRRRAASQFSWLKRRLVYMKEEMGVRQAGALAERLQFYDIE